MVGTRDLSTPAQDSRTCQAHCAPQTFLEKQGELPKKISGMEISSHIFILNILIPVVHYKEYYLTTKDSITIPFIIQKLVDQPFELLKENKSLGRLSQEKKFILFKPLFYQVSKQFSYTYLHVFCDLAYTTFWIK